MIIVFNFGKTLEVVAVLAMLLAIFDSPFTKTCDSFSKTFSEINQTPFSRIRAFGSLAYFASTLLAGYMISWFGYHVTIVVAGLFILISSLFSYLIKPLDLEAYQNEKVNAKSEKVKIKINFKLIHYILLVSFVSAIIGCISEYTSIFLTENYHLTTIQYGYISSAIVLLEGLTLATISAKIVKKAPYLCIFLSLFLYLLKYVCFVTNAPLWITIPVVLLTGVGQGINIGAVFEYLKRIVGINSIARVSLWMAVCSGVVTIIYDLVQSKILEVLSFVEYFRYAIIILPIILLIMIALYLAFSKNKLFTE